MPFGCVFPLLCVFFGYVCTYSSKILPRYYSKILLRYYFKILLQNTTPALLQSADDMCSRALNFLPFGCVFPLLCVFFGYVCTYSSKILPRYHSKILLRYYFKILLQNTTPVLLQRIARESICTFRACIKDIGRCKKQMTCAFWTNVRRCKKQMTCALVILGVCPTKPMSSATSIDSLGPKNLLSNPPKNCRKIRVTHASKYINGDNVPKIIAINMLMVNLALLDLASGNQWQFTHSRRFCGDVYFFFPVKVYRTSFGTNISHAQ